MHALSCWSLPPASLLVLPPQLLTVPSYLHHRTQASTVCTISLSCELPLKSMQRDRFMLAASKKLIYPWHPGTGVCRVSHPLTWKVGMALIPHSAATACMQAQGQCKALCLLSRVFSAGKDSLLASCVPVHCYPMARRLTAGQATTPHVHFMVLAVALYICSWLIMPAIAFKKTILRLQHVV